MRLQAIGWLSAIVIASTLHASNSTPKLIIEIPAANKEVRSQVANLGYALDEILSDKVFVIGTEADVAKLQAAGFKTTARKYQERFRKFEAFGPGMTYHSYQDVVAQLKDLSQRYPQIATIESLGKSHENRDMTMIRLSGVNKVDAEVKRLPVVFYTGCHHAREYISVEVPLLYAKYLASEYAAGNPKIKSLLDSREVYIAPIINPDGYVYDFISPTSSGRMWRKNRRDNLDGTFGVDLNRNYGWGWNTGGSSSDTDSEVYMGPGPFSEPETQAVRDFVDSQPRMTTLLTLHSFSELVLYPWSGSNDKVGDKVGRREDLPIFEKMAHDMAAWNKYTPEQSSDLYIASGDTTDWAYGTHGIFAFTIELSPTSMWEGGFYPGVGAISPTFEANIKPMLYLLEYANDPSRVLREEIPSFDTTPAKRGVAVASFKDAKI